MVTDLLDRVRDEAGLFDRGAARVALRSVVCALRERLSPQEADALRAILAPFPEAFTCDRRGHTHRPASRSRDRLTEPELVARVMVEVELPDPAAARRVTRAVLAALAEEPGQAVEEQPANEALSTGLPGRPRRGPGEDDDEG